MVGYPRRHHSLIHWPRDGATTTTTTHITSCYFFLFFFCCRCCETFNPIEWNWFGLFIFLYFLFLMPSTTRTAAPTSTHWHTKEQESYIAHKLRPQVVPSLSVAGRSSINGGLVGQFANSSLVNICLDVVSLPSSSSLRRVVVVCP